MASIDNLLNPMPDESDPDQRDQLPSPCSTASIREFSPAPPRKKTKLSKDAAIFIRNATRGEVNYPPYEYEDLELAARHTAFQIHPMGHVAEFPRHIPYNSEKKAFLEKTGRESFEVFQYEFKVPGDDKVYAMMWDYNIGLVRTTPLFRCNNYSKTTPAKMLNLNPGLKDICHSITGGALVAQGYWMPFEAAKAVAATFCWNMRYALTPIFGKDFLSLCVRPDSERFGEMVIDPAITRRCIEEARHYRLLQTQSGSRTPSTLRSPVTPDRSTCPRYFKHLRPKSLDSTEVGSKYWIESDNEDRHYVSESPTSRSAWTPANTPRSAPRPDLRLPSPQEILADTSIGKMPRTMRESSVAHPSRLAGISPPLTRESREADEGYEGNCSSHSTPAERKDEPTMDEIHDAAQSLMSLRNGV